MAKTNFQTIDEYIKTFPEDIRRILEVIRQTIQKAAPDAEETISYQIPAFKLNGNLVYFAGWKNHIGIYPISSAMGASIKELSAYKTSGKGTVQFPIDKPVPLSLIRKIVKYRLKENLERRKRNK